MKNINKKIIILAFGALLFSACNKWVEIDPPKNSISTKQVFSDSANAKAAVIGVYSKLALTGVSLGFCTGSLTTDCGTYVDEMVYNQSDPNAQALNRSELTSLSPEPNSLWTEAYQIIYQINAGISGIAESSTLSSTYKKRLTSELKFIRAFIYFNLINLYGDVPFVTSIDWKETSKTPRTNIQIIYQELIKDLTEGSDHLPDNYADQNGMRTRATKWASYALLSKIYLYLGNWQEGKRISDLIVENHQLFSLELDLNKIFLKESKEAILQWDLNPENFPNSATPEGYYFNSENISFTISENLYNSFELGDVRKSNWVRPFVSFGTIYYLPYKYKIGINNATEEVTELYTVFRLSEIYLISAETNARLNNLEIAINVLNAVRLRADLDPYPDNLSKAELLEKIAHERRIELFCEWGNRFFDLKRTGKASSVLFALKPTWRDNALLWPIPRQELITNPFMTQNPGY